MRRDVMRATVSVLCLLTAMPATLNAQSYVPAPYAAQQPDLSYPPPPDEGGQAYGQPYAPPPGAPPQSAQPVAAMSAGQLDQVLAPVALYPDDLLSQVLMAATYPLDVVEAARWAQDPAHAGLRGEALTAALEQQPWDPSVKALVPFPQVLAQLNDHLDWTQQLGQAFLAQQDAVMDSVQRLRQQAAANGALQSTPQQQIVQDSGTIEILPADPSTVYVPSYDPRVVYGAWPYPDYPPLYFAPPPVYAVRPIYPGFAFFTAGVLVGGAAWWGWHHWDWRDHRITIDSARYARLNFGRPPLRRDVWVHDAARDRGFSQRVFSGRPVGGFAGRAAPAPNAFRGAPGPGARSFSERAAPVGRPDGRDFRGRPGQAQPQNFARQAAPPATAPAPRNFSRAERASPPPQAQPQNFARQAAPPAAAPAPRNFSRAERASPPPQAQPQAFRQRPSGPPRESVARAAPPPQPQRAAPPQPQPQRQAHAAPAPQQHAAPAPAPQQHAAPAAQPQQQRGGGKRDEHQRETR